MSIEEIFELIRKGISSAIRESNEEKIRNEFLADFLDKSKFLAVKVNNKPYKNNLEVKRILEQEQSDNFVKAFQEEAQNYSFNLETLYKIKSYFGKREIQGRVENFSLLFVVLNMVNRDSNFVLDKGMFLKVFGMAIYNNNKIFEKRVKERNKCLNSKDYFLRKETKAVINLKPYFNAFGDVIANDDTITLVDNLFDLFATYYDNEESDKLLEECNFNATSFIQYINEQLLIANSNKKYIEDDLAPLSEKTISKSERRQLKEQQRLNEQELATYCDGKNILRSCDSLEGFITLVNSCNLTNENKDRIISKMNTFLSKETISSNIAFLTDEEKEIFKLAQEKQIGNIQIKDYLSEINILLEMFHDNISKEDKEYIENEVRNIIKSLGFILNINPLSLTF